MALLYKLFPRKRKYSWLVECLSRVFWDQKTNRMITIIMWKNDPDRWLSSSAYCYVESSRTQAFGYIWDVTRRNSHPECGWAIPQAGSWTAQKGEAGWASTLALPAYWLQVPHDQLATWGCCHPAFPSRMDCIFKSWAKTMPSFFRFLCEVFYPCNKESTPDKGNQ